MRHMFLVFSISILLGLIYSSNQYYILNCVNSSILYNNSLSFVDSMNISHNDTNFTITTNTSCLPVLMSGGLPSNPNTSNGDCFYIVPNMYSIANSNDPVITSSTILSNQQPQVYIQKSCTNSLVVNNITINNTTIVNTTILNVTNITTTNYSCFIPNATTKFIDYGSNFTDTYSNTTYCAPSKITDTYKIDYGNTITNFLNTGATIQGPPLCPQQQTCSVCPTCEVCKQTTCPEVFNLANDVILNEENSSYSNSLMGPGRIICNISYKQLSIFQDTNCTTRLSMSLDNSTNFTYCPGHIGSACSDSEKLMGEPGLEVCVNRISTSMSDSNNQLRNQLYASQQDLSHCNSGQESSMQLQELIIQFAVLVIIGIAIGYWILESRKRSEVGD